MLRYSTLVYRHAGFTGITKPVALQVSPWSLKCCAFSSITLYGSHQPPACIHILGKANLGDRDVCHLYLSGRNKERWLRERIVGDFHANSPSRGCSSAILRVPKFAVPTVQTLALLFDRYDEQSPSNAMSPQPLRAHHPQLEHDAHHSLRIPPVPLAKAASHLSPLFTRLRISRFVVPRPLRSHRITSCAAWRDCSSRITFHSRVSAGAQARPCPDAGAAAPSQRARAGCLADGFPFLSSLRRGALADISVFSQTLSSRMAYQLEDVAILDVQRKIVVSRPTMWNAARL